MDAPGFAAAKRIVGRINFLDELGVGVLCCIIGGELLRLEVLCEDSSSTATRLLGRMNFCILVP